jgi:hypothetical protein
MDSCFDLQQFALLLSSFLPIDAHNVNIDKVYYKDLTVFLFHLLRDESIICDSSD